MTGSEPSTPRSIPADHALVWWVGLAALLPGLPGWRGVTGTAVDAVGLILLGIVLLGALREGRFLQGSGAQFLGLMFFLALGIRTRMLQGPALGDVLLALGFFLAGSVLHPRAARRLPGTVAAGGVLCVAVSAWLWIGWIPKDVVAWWRALETDFEGFPRLAGTFPHANVFAYYLLLLAWAGMALVWQHRRRGGGNAWAGFAVLVLALGMLPLTLSRAVLLTAAALVPLAAIVAAGLRLWSWRTAALTVGLGLGALVFGMSLQADAWLGRALQTGDDLSRGLPEPPPLPEVLPAGMAAGPRLSHREVMALHRWEVWQEAVDLWKSSPWLGLGVGGFHRWGRGHFHAHNVGLELLVSGGLVAMGLLGATFVAVLRRGGFRRRLPLLGLCAMVFVAGVLDCFLFFRYPLLLFAFTLGILCRPEGPDATPGMLGAAWSPWLPWRSSPAALGWAVAAGGTFLAFVAGRHAVLLDNHWVAPCDSFTYMVAARYTALTGEAPYVSWPSALEIPENHPVGQVAAALGGVSLRFFYPPTSLLLFQPFALLGSAGAMAWLYFALQIASLVAAVAGAVRLAGERWRPEALGFIPLLWYLHADTSLDLIVGNVSLLLGAAAIWSWVLHREGRSFSAGFLIALAAGLKLFPLLWLGYAIVRPRGTGRLLAGAVAGGALLVGGSLLAFGPEVWQVYHRWVVTPLNTYPPPGTNIALMGLLQPHVNAYAAEQRLWLLGAGAVLALAGVWRQRRSGQFDVLAPVVVVAGSLLALPIAWTHCSLMVLPFVAVLALDFPRRGLTPPAFLALVVWGLSSQFYTPDLAYRAAILGSGALLLAVLASWLPGCWISDPARADLPRSPAPGAPSSPPC